MASGLTHYADLVIMRRMDKPKTFGVSVDPETHKLISAFAFDNGLSNREVVRDAVRAWVQPKPKKRKETRPCLESSQQSS